MTMQYEALRRQIMDAAAPANVAQGWALVARRGLAAWMRAWAPTQGAESAAAPTDVSAGAPVWPAPLQSEIVRLLTDMTLGHLSLQISPQYFSHRRS